MNFYKTMAMSISIFALVLSQGFSMEGRHQLPQTNYGAIANAFRQMADPTYPGYISTSQSQASTNNGVTTRSTSDAEFVELKQLQAMNNGTGANVRRYGVVVFDPPLSAAQMAHFPYSAMLNRLCTSPGNTIWTLACGNIKLDVTANVKTRQ